MTKKKNTQEICVAIRLFSGRKPSNRYILWIDEHWYETTNEPAYVIPEKEINKVKELLVSHFKYRASFIYRDGTETAWSAFDGMKKKKPKFVFGGLKGISFFLRGKTK